VKSLLTFFLFFTCLFLYGQERYVNIDGQKFRIKEYGVGDVTVIFESGMSDSLEAWGLIPDTVASFAHVFLYDRADIGKSDTSRQKRTIPNMVLELRSILNQENIRPPYILVGHSLGGYITRYFSSQFPNDVKGLLMLDPAGGLLFCRVVTGNPKGQSDERTRKSTLRKQRFFSGLAENQP